MERNHPGIFSKRFVIEAFFKLLSWFPLFFLHNLASVLGWVYWIGSSRYRKLIRGNLEQAGLGSITNRVIPEAGKPLLELPKIWLRPDSEVLGRLNSIEGEDLLKRAICQPQGVLIITPHLGSFEMVARYCAQFGNFIALYRQPRKAFLTNLVLEGRQRHYGVAEASRSGIKKIIRANQEGKMIGLLPDQTPGYGSGIWSSWFGRSAYTMTLPAKLVEKGAKVLFVLAIRQSYGAGYNISIQEPSCPIIGTVEEKTAALNACLEGLIRQYPDQYMWGYKRYKNPPGFPG